MTIVDLVHWSPAKLYQAGYTWNNLVRMHLRARMLRPGVGFWDPMSIAEVYPSAYGASLLEALRFSIDDLVRLQPKAHDLEVLGINVDMLIDRLDMRKTHLVKFPKISLTDWSTKLGLKTTHLNGVWHMSEREYLQLESECGWDLNNISKSVDVKVDAIAI